MSRLTRSPSGNGSISGSAGAPGRKKKPVGRRTLERYGELLRCHVVPTLGKRPLQQLQATDIDTLYQALDGRMSPRTAHHVHIVLGACLATAVRKGLLTTYHWRAPTRCPPPAKATTGWRWTKANSGPWLRASRARCFPDRCRRGLHGRAPQRNSGVALDRSRRGEQDPADRAGGRAGAQTAADPQGAENRARQAHHHDRRWPDRDTFRRAGAYLRLEAGVPDGARSICRWSSCPTMP